MLIKSNAINSNKDSVSTFHSGASGQLSEGALALWAD